MNEFDLIARLIPSLATHPAVVVPAGDDCAVLDLGLPERLLVFKTDAVVEGVHFTRQAEPPKVGHKALARCLSDLAAMAATPVAAVVTLALPAQWELAWVDGVYAGLNMLARRHGVAIVGGETTSNPERALLSVAVLGTVAKGRQVLRSGAQPGDALFVTGELGGSLAGRHLDFEPRLAEAQWLVEHFELHAMIDLSDGLAGDLPHLLKASRVGAELLAEAIPISHAAKRRARTGLSAKTPLEAALSDGEDFELLFTVPSRAAVPLLDAWQPAFPNLKLTCLGKITPEPGLRVRSRRGLEPLTSHGYVHFEQS